MTILSPSVLDMYPIVSVPDIHNVHSLIMPNRC